MTDTPETEAALRLWWCPAWGTLNAIRYHGLDGPDDPNCGKVSYVRCEEAEARSTGTPTLREALLTMRGYSLDFDAVDRWLVMTDPDGASMIVAENVNLEYGGDIASRWRLAGTATPSPTPRDRELLGLVNEQAEDEGLWFVARTAPEAYLQQELRRLHAAIEAVPAGAHVLGNSTWAVDRPPSLDVERLARAIDRVDKAIHVRFPVATETSRIKAALLALAAKLRASPAVTEPICICGTDATLAAGETMFARLDVVCSKHDRSFG